MTETKIDYIPDPSPDLAELEALVDFRMFTMTADEYTAALFQDSLGIYTAIGRTFQSSSPAGTKHTYPYQ